jgi:hypothetical protein
VSKNKTIVELLYEAIENRDLSVPKFSKQTGIPKDRVYKWKQENTAPKSDDEKIIRNWLNMENVPSEGMVNEDQVAYYSGPVDLGKEFGKLKEWQIMVDATLEVLIAELVPLIAKTTGKSNAGVFSQMQRDIAGSVEQKMVLPKKKK